MGEPQEKPRTSSLLVKVCNEMLRIIHTFVFLGLIASQRAMPVPSLQNGRWQESEAERRRAINQGRTALEAQTEPPSPSCHT